MLSCDYNGWTDVPEDQREAVEAFEAALTFQTPPARLAQQHGLIALLPIPRAERRAA